MQDREVVQFIRYAVEKLHTKEDAETIYRKIEAEMPDKNQFNRCLKMYIWVNQTCDAICNPKIDFDYSRYYENYKSYKNILDLSRLPSDADAGINIDFILDADTRTEFVSDINFNSRISTLKSYIYSMQFDFYRSKLTGFDFDTDDDDFDDDIYDDLDFNFNKDCVDTGTNVRVVIKSVADYQKCLGYLFDELNYRNCICLYKVKWGTYEAFYTSRFQALLQQLCLRESSFKAGLKSKVAKIYKLKELYNLYSRYIYIKAVDIDMDEFLLIQDFKKIDADPSACTNDTDRAIAMFHLIDELGLSNLVDTDNFLLNLLENSEHIDIKSYCLFRSDDLKCLFGKEG